jgi:hypothetical protein
MLRHLRRGNGLTSEVETAPPDAAQARPGDFASRLAGARSRLKEKLAQTDLAALGLSPYNQRYLGHKLQEVENELRQVGDLLTLCLAKSPVALRDFAMVDYGGGSGIISLLAKELGVGTVVYNDIYDVSCADVARLSAALGLRLEHIVCGDVGDVVRYVREHGLQLNAVVSYDVLEHIYDVETHFRDLAEAPFSGEYFRLLYASGANIKNARYVRSVTNVHTTDELTGTTPEWGHKERDAVRPFLEIRRELVAAAAPDLGADDVEKLATATRGLRQDDIEKVVAQYVTDGSISYRPDHPTNTCDPYTGNWSEHLMEPSWVEAAARKAGFAARILAGRYAPGGSRAKSAAKLVVNVAIRLLGRRALPVAPYYVVYATAVRPASSP